MERNQAGGGWPRTFNRAKGAALGRRRKELQLTQEELTQKLKLRGVRPLYLWEEGRAWPETAMTRRLEKALYGRAVPASAVIAVGYDPQPPMLFHEPSRFCVRTR